MQIPCKNGDLFEVGENVKAAYKVLHGDATDAAFARMTIWLAANPKRLPASKAAAMRFVRNWFKKVPLLSPGRNWADRKDRGRAVMRALTTVDVDSRDVA